MGVGSTGRGGPATYDDAGAPLDVNYPLALASGSPNTKEGRAAIMLVSHLFFFAITPSLLTTLR